MKIALGVGLIGLLSLASCDHIENPYPPAEAPITWGLYPDGDSLHYYENVYQAFTPNQNTNRNVLVEDFTGHKCNSCPEASEFVSEAISTYPNRAFGISIHASPAGTGPLQEVDPPHYLEDFTCAEGIELGKYFGMDWPSSDFIGNPGGGVSRIDNGSGQVMSDDADWVSLAGQYISSNDLKVNLQSQVNYFENTRGLFVHVEADILDASLSNELKIVAILIEDSKAGPQLFPTGDSLDYTHKHIMRGTLDGKAFGQTLDIDHLDQNGNYYFHYVNELAAGYDPENMSLIIYVRDAVTEEIYQVIEKHIQ